MRYIISLLIACFALVTPAGATFMRPSDAPVDRLIKNAEAYVTENPKDADGHYVLGRIHYLAWSIKTGQVPVYRLPEQGKAIKPNIPADHLIYSNVATARNAEAQRRALAEYKVESVRDVPRESRQKFWQRIRAIDKELREANWKPDGLTETQLDQHAQAAIKSFNKSIELNENNGLYRLSRASLRKQYAERAKAIGLSPDGQTVSLDSAVLKQQWLSAAMADYKQAFELSASKDAKLEYQPLSGIRSLVSYQSAEGYRDLALELGEDSADKELIAKMQTHQKMLKELPRGPITPIVFSLQPHKQLSDLIDDRSAVSFDLIGAGRAEKWQWVKPGTALLVWDPAGAGRITSGRQLFGSVTWWLMPADGYRAMDLLDDNRDGELAGAELAGLSAWFDRNTNGVSDVGEVVTLRDLGVAGIAVKALSRDGQALMHPRGLRMNDGRTVPTYDWIAKPAGRR